MNADTVGPASRGFTDWDALAAAVDGLTLPGTAEIAAASAWLQGWARCRAGVSAVAVPCHASRRRSAASRTRAGQRRDATEDDERAATLAEVA